MPSLADHVVLITGASSGIGEALALELARRGADLVLVARRQERLDQLADRILATGRRAVPIVADVTSQDSLGSAVERALVTFHRLDVVVANAGYGVSGRFNQLTLEDYKRQFETNVFGVVRTVEATLEALEQSRGRLALMGSVAGYVAAPGMSPYAMSKFALRAFADSLREELRPKGVSVTLISPGFVTSEIRRVDRLGVLHPEAPDPVPSWIQMPAETAARHIATAIARRRPEIVVTAHGKLIVQLARHAPRTMRLLARLLARPVRKV